MKQFVKRYIFLFSVLVGFCFLIACASIGNPSGGDYDLDPPKMVRSYPAFNEKNVTSSKIVLEFDENVTVDKPNENVIITPPQQKLPVIQAVNRKIYVELKDSLLPNTTYTIDFTNSILDNNEGNPLENFAISFSTGDIVDSMVVSGKVLEASNLEPIKGIYVGLHSNLNDTAFTKEKFTRISRTNDRGAFSIKGVAPGKYKIYALNDANRDYKYDNPSEAIAFLDSIIVPSTVSAERFDTLFNKKDTLAIDTIKSIRYTRFLPDNILLRSFTSAFQRQYLQKYEREGNKLNIIFGAPTQKPQLEALSFDGSREWALFEQTLKNDTLTYWVKDPDILKMDTLAFKITYMKTDSLNQEILTVDTINFINRARKKTEKELKKEAEELQKMIDEGKQPPVKFLDIKNNLAGSWDVYKNIELEFGEPLADSLEHKIVLQQKVDSLYKDIPFRLVTDSLNPRKYSIRNKWEYGAEYKISIDSASLKSLYGLWNNKLEQTLKVRKEDEYGALIFRIQGISTDIPSFIELLDKADKPIRKIKVKDNVAVFRNLNPGEYYARIVLDTNNNGVWDTGDYNKKLQPEMVCYNSNLFKVKPYFDEEYDWIVNTDNLDKQKPLEITKQKPQEKETKRQQLEKEEQKKNSKENRNQNSRSSSEGTYTDYGQSQTQY